ncbi:hypothetical protein [Paenibacillus sp. 1001270B_150601_E10]|uniref:DUF6060 domain-containing protein n=1 Tax=Paenibacillus sp. 1001270B_150601_E10 TaxID=2787079 RepID=UPI00189D8413|nr:hypothetical protein [Paenibacillus sp. 1001270B_150601_E10]
MKRVSAFIIMIFLIFSLGSVVNASASSSKVEENTYRVSGSGEQVLAVYEIGLDGVLVEVPIEVYKAEMEKETKEQARLVREILQADSSLGNSVFGNSAISPLGVIITKYYTYESLNTFDFHRSPVKVSNAINCNSTTECPITTQWSETVTHSLSATIDTSEKIQAIQLGAGYNYSSAKSKLLSYTLPVPVGKRAYVGFQPKVRQDYGSLKYWDRFGNNITLISSVSASTTYPLKNGDGTAQGYYLLIDDVTNQPL